jgi:hypothetical protein
MKNDFDNCYQTSGNNKQGTIDEATLLRGIMRIKHVEI